MRPLLCLLVLFALVFPAAARLGETEKEIEKRYGKPVRSVEKDRRKQYNWEGFSVWVYFDDRFTARSVKETFAYLSPEELFDDPTVESLLRANLGDSKWNRGVKFEMKTNVNLRSGYHEVWKRKDGKVVAVHSFYEFITQPASDVFQVMVKDLYDADKYELKQGPPSF